MNYPKGVKAIYDNGGKTWDRYSVYYSDRKAWGEDRPKMWPMVGMSLNPFQGFGQHGSGMLGRHNGKRIAFEDLPKECQKLVNRDLK